MTKSPTISGVRFIDAVSSREMILVDDGPYKGWIVFRHPDGQRVTLRKATKEDRRRIEGAPVASLVIVVPPKEET